MPDIKDIPSCCADSGDLPGITTNLSEARHTGQRPTRTTRRMMDVCRAHAQRFMSCRPLVRLAHNPYYLVRVGFCPLFDHKKALCSELSRTYHNENSFLLSFFTKDG